MIYIIIIIVDISIALYLTDTCEHTALYKGGKGERKRT